MKRAVTIVSVFLAGAALAGAQALPALDGAAVARVERVLDESSCDADSRGMAAQALRELEGVLAPNGTYESRRLPAPLLRALGALANGDPTSRAATVADALASPDAMTAMRGQCGDPSSLARRVARMSTTDRVREVWRSCRLDSAGLVRPRRGLEAADGFVQVVAAVVGHLTRASGSLEPVEVRLLQTMVSGSAPRCGTSTPPASDGAPEWLRDAPPPSRREEDDRRYRIER